MSLFSLTRTSRADPATFDFELVERNGIGHPDSIANAIAEEMSRLYANHSLQRFGVIAHHWFDKVMIVGGHAHIDFLRTEVLRSPHFILAGKAILRVGTEAIPLQDIFETAVSTILRSALKGPGTGKRHICEVRVQDSAGPGERSTRYRPTSIDELRKFEAQDIVSDDSHLCVGFAPFSPTESLVLDIERFLTSPSQEISRPWLGRDIKTTASRVGSITHVVVNVPMLAIYVQHFSAYRGMREELEHDIREFCTQKIGACSVSVNPDPGLGRACLTVTGSRLDTGDTGISGRGNRASGLVTPMRSMSIETSVGKNPHDQSGKLLNICARRISEAVHKEFNFSCTAHVLAMKGDRLEAPARLALEYSHDADLDAASRTRIETLARDQLAQLDKIRDQLLSGSIKLW
jgi:S-adenosylmethionine synthetase